MIDYSTTKNTKGTDKPNEDLFFFDNQLGFILILDGVSRDRINGIYPNPSPALQTAKIISKESYNYFLNHYDELKDCPELLLKKSVLAANKSVELYNKSHTLSFAAGAVGIFCLIQNGNLYYLYIGDCYGRYIKGETVSLFTECQTEKIQKHKKEYTSCQIRNEICNNPFHSCGYGVINGDQQAEYFMKTGMIKKEQYECIVLSTDGPEEYLKTCNAEQLRGHSCKELIELAVHGIDQDDMTILIIK